MLTPMEIQKKEFDNSFKGYSVSQVDIFLEQVTSDYEALYRENLDLRDQVQRFKSGIRKYQELEDLLKNSLMLAEKTAADIKANANQEGKNILEQYKIRSEYVLNEAEARADRLVKEAENKADILVAVAIEKAKQISSEAQANAENVRQQLDRLVDTELSKYHDLQNQARQIKICLKSFLGSQLEIVDKVELEGVILKGDILKEGQQSSIDEEELQHPEKQQQQEQKQEQQQYEENYEQYSDSDRIAYGF